MLAGERPAAIIGEIDTPSILNVMAALTSGVSLVSSRAPFYA